MNLRKLVIGSQLFFAREGTVIGVAPAAHTVSQAWKPDVEEAPPYTHWASLGGCVDFTPTPKVTEQDVMEPTPGAYRRTDVVVTGTALDLSFSLTNVSELFFESLLLAGGAITDDYQPGTGSGQIRGWLKCQQYDQGDAQRNVFDVYVSGMFKAQKMENKLIVAQFDAKVLYSALQSGNLSLA